MNFISDKELDTRLKDLKELIKEDIKPGEAGSKPDINSAAINTYQLKGIKDGKTAWILYNLGVDATQLDNDPNHEETGAKKFTYNENNYNLLEEAGLRDFVQVKSQDINPLLDANTSWVNTGGEGKGQVLTEKEKTLITDNTLNTAEAVHAGAVLLAHLRAVKEAAHKSNNYQLDQKENTVLPTGEEDSSGESQGNAETSQRTEQGTANENEAINRDWTAATTNQSLINTQITKPIATKHYQLLEKYAAAAEGTPEKLAWNRANHGDFGGIANKIWKKAKSLNNQEFVEQFKKNQIVGNRTDWNWTQLTIEGLKEVFGSENFKEGKYIGGGAAEEREYLLLDKIKQEKIDEALNKIKDKWIRKDYKKLTSRILNDFLGDWKDKRKQEWIPLKTGQDDDFYGTLVKEGGYRIDKNPDGTDNPEGKKILQEEKKFQIEEKGALLLDYFYEKVDFNIDLPIDKQKFCKLVEIEEKEKKIKVLNTSGPAVLPIGTGVGKTTKTINCLTRGGERNVILVCPTSALVQSASGHHKNWLQDWECVYHKEMEGGKQVWVDAVDKNGKPILDGAGNRKKRRKYIHHGKYEVFPNDLVHTVDKEDQHIEMKNGLSILEPGYLFGYLTRRLLIDEWNRARPKDKIKEWFLTEEINKFKEKLIDKENTIIVFDEAHFGVAMYKELIRQAIRLNYNVICMSATFKSIEKKPVPFSLTSSYNIDSRLVSGFEQELDKNLKNEKTFIFLKNMKLSEKQKAILEESGISYIIFDKAYEPAAEGISEGMPPGSLMIGDNTYEMGFTFDIHNAISTNWMEISNLGAGWNYDTPETQRLPLASMGQQRGRVGRKQDGKWYILSDEIKEMTVTSDFAAKLVRAILTKDVKAVKPKSEKLSDQDYWVYLAGGISLEEKFGLSPEAIVIGLTGSPNKPKFHNEDKKKPSGCDEGLWYKHVNKKDKPIEMTSAELVEAKETLKLMVDTLLNKQKDFPYKIRIEIENPLIEKTKLKVEEVRPILNSFIDKKINELYNHEDYDKEKKSSKDEKLIKDIAELHKIALEEKLIEIVKEDKDPNDPKKGKRADKTLWILYKAQKIEEEVKPRSYKRSTMITEKEKLDEIKNYLGMLLDMWEGGNPSSKEIRSAFKINTMFGYKELVGDMKEDGNIKEAERLEELIERLENYE